MSEREERIAAIRAAFLVGVRKHFPQMQTVEMVDDALIDLYELGILDAPPAEFEAFLAGLRDPPEPQPVEAEDDEPAAPPTTT